MEIEPDDYEVFLQDWEAGDLLKYSVLPHNLNDPSIRRRLFDDSTGNAQIERAANIKGKKQMQCSEAAARGYSFFEDRHKCWAEEFKDYVLEYSMPEKKLNEYLRSFSQIWVDGRKRRQDSAEMLAIKASIRDHDQHFHPSSAGKFVVNSVDAAIEPLFTPPEMAIIFQANEGLMNAFLPDYIDYLGESGPASLDDLYVRRGVLNPSGRSIRLELNYLSSFSLALGPVEQFAQTGSPPKDELKDPAVVSAPLPAIQKRVVAFAPFVAEMDLSQLEIVLAPPIHETLLLDHGVHGGIRELSFE